MRWLPRRRVWRLPRWRRGGGVAWVRRRGLGRAGVAAAEVAAGAVAAVVAASGLAAAVVAAAAAARSVASGSVVARAARLAWAVRLARVAAALGERAACAKSKRKRETRRRFQRPCDG